MQTILVAYGATTAVVLARQGITVETVLGAALVLFIILAVGYDSGGSDSS
jgi:hypothetical protein